MTDSSSARLSQLDVLRAVAVVMVVASHMDVPPPDANLAVVTVSGFFRNYGGFGVDLFFVLSGFLVSGLLFREYARTRSVDTTRFLIRRGLKIYPAFYAFVVITVLLRIQRGTVFSWPEILREIFFVQNYGQGVWTHTWSLAVEEHFYLLLVGLVLVLIRVRPEDPFANLGIVFGVVAAIVLGLRIVTFLLVPYSYFTHVSPTHLRLDALFFGVLLARSYHLNARFVERVTRARVAIFAGSVALLVLSQWIPSAFAQYVFGLACVYVGFGGVVLASVCAGPRSSGTGSRMWPAVAKVGSFSYSIYLWHTAVIVFGSILVTKLLGADFGYYGLILFRMTASIVFGIVMAKLVEMPVLRLRDRLFPSRSVT